MYTHNVHTHTQCARTHTHTHTAKKPNTIPWHNRTEIINDPNKISMKRCKSFNLHWRLGGKKLTDTTIYELVTPQTWMRLLSISRYSWSTCTCPLYTSTHFRLYTQTFIKQLAHIWIRTTSESPIWKRLVRARKSPAVNESCICEPSTRARLGNVRLQNVLDRIFIDEDGDRETDDGWQPNSDESEEEEEEEVSELVGEKWQQHCLASARREFSEFCHQFCLLLLAPKWLGPGEVTHSESLGRNGLKFSAVLLLFPDRLTSQRSWKVFKVFYHLTTISSQIDVTEAVVH